VLMKADYTLARLQRGDQLRCTIRAAHNQGVALEAMILKTNMPPGLPSGLPPRRWTMLPDATLNCLLRTVPAAAGVAFPSGAAVLATERLNAMQRRNHASGSIGPPGLPWPLESSPGGRCSSRPCACGMATMPTALAQNVLAAAYCRNGAQRAARREYSLRWRRKNLRHEALLDPPR
jgi:fructose-bisphosphate aldolase class I